MAELFNVADASKQLLPAACVTYKRKYGKKTIRVRTLKFDRQAFHENECGIFVNGSAMCLKFLRYFGLLIKELEIGYFPMRRNYQTILDHYIGKFCAAAVIKIDGSSKRAVMPNFSKCFPNVQHLELRDCYIGHLTHTAGHLPNLKHLTISVNEDRSRHTISTNLILSNPQLKSLTLRWNVNLNLLRAVSEHLEELESLDLIIEEWDDSASSATVAEVLKFKNVRQLRFGLFCMFDMPNIVMSFDRLEDFTLAPMCGYFRDFSGLMG